MNRREFCKKVGAAGTLGACAGAIPGSASASRVAGVVSTRGHYDVTWWNAVRRTWGTGEYEYDVESSVPGFDGPAPGELVVFAHGWLLNDWTADTNFEYLADSLSANGYDGPLVGFEWDADEVLAVDDWYPSVEIARRNGKKLGAFLRDYRDRNPDATIRLVGHSLGAQVVLSTASRLDRWERRDVVDSIALLGAAVEDEIVSTAATYGGSLGRAVGETDNFHSINDGTIAAGIAGAQFDRALGNVGAEGPVPEGYEDHAAPEVTGHFEYFVEGSGCIDEVVREWTGTREDDGSTRRVETGSLDGAGDADVYRHEPASSAGRVSVSLSAAAGTDFDLYVTFDGREPSTDDFDRRSAGYDSDERVVVDAAGVEGLGILVSAYDGRGDYELVVAPAG